MTIIAELPRESPGNALDIRSSPPPPSVGDPAKGRDAMSERHAEPNRPTVGELRINLAPGRSCFWHREPQQRIL